MLTQQNENILLQARRFAVWEDIPLLCGVSSNVLQEGAASAES